jgi:hypothetical protein
MNAVALALILLAGAPEHESACEKPWIRGPGRPMFLDRLLQFEACGLDQAGNDFIIDEQLNGSCTFDPKLSLATCSYQQPVLGAASVAVLTVEGRTAPITVVFAREATWSQRLLVPFACLLLLALYFALWANFIGRKPLLGWAIALGGFYLAASLARSLQLERLELATPAYTAPLLVALVVVSNLSAEPRWWRPFNGLAMLLFAGLNLFDQGALIGFLSAPDVHPALLAMYAIALGIRHVHRSGHRFRSRRQDREATQEVRPVHRLRLEGTHVLPQRRAANPQRETGSSLG